MWLRVLRWTLISALIAESAAALDPLVFSNRNQPDQLPPPLNVSVSQIFDHPYAIAFTTNATDTELKKVKLHIENAGPNTNFNVAVHEVDNTGAFPKPGNFVARFPDPPGAPGSIDGDIELSFPGTLTLLPNSPYFLVFEDSLIGARTQSPTRIGVGSDLSPTKYALGIPGVSPTVPCRRVGSVWGG